MTIVYHSHEELMAADNPHEDYVNSWLYEHGDWHCRRCHIRQIPNTNRYWRHDDACCDGGDTTGEWYGPLCPHCAEGLQP